MHRVANTIALNVDIVAFNTVDANQIFILGNIKLIENCIIILITHL